MIRGIIFDYKSMDIEKIGNEIFKNLEMLSEKDRQEIIEKIERFSMQRKFFHKSHKIITHPIALSPFILSSSVLPLLNKLSRSIYLFQSKLPKLYFENFLDIRDICPLSKQEEKWFFQFYKYDRNKNFIIRLDVGLAQGWPIVFENNTVANAGLYNHTMGVEILKSFIFPKLSINLKDPPNLLKFSLDFIRESKQGIRNLGFIECLDTYGYSEIPKIVEYFRKSGFRVGYGDPKELKIKNNKVFLGGIKPDLVYRDISYKDIKFDKQMYSGLVKLIEEGKVVPGFSGEFGHKGILECLTSNRYNRFFRMEERKLFKNCVPWTRVILERETDLEGEKTDLIDYIKNNKDEFLIKPNKGAGGEKILIGKEVSRSRWNKRIKLAIKQKGRWVVQKYCETQTRKMAYLKDGKIYFRDCYFSLGLFYYFDKLGLHCRISPSKIVNVAKGGALAPVFLL